MLTCKDARYSVTLYTRPAFKESGVKRHTKERQHAKQASAFKRRPSHGCRRTVNQSFMLALLSRQRQANQTKKPSRNKNAFIKCPCQPGLISSRGRETERILGEKSTMNVNGPSSVCCTTSVKASCIVFTKRSAMGCGCCILRKTQWVRPNEPE